MTMLLPRFAGYLVWVVIGVAAGQLAAWVVGIVATFTNVAGLAASLLGEEAALGLVFVAGSLAYASVTGLAVASGLSLLRVSENGAGEIAGLAAGAAAFLLVTVLADAYVRFLASVFPDAVTLLLDASGLQEVLIAIILHTIPIAIIGLATYAALTLVSRVRDGSKMEGKQDA